MSYSYERLRTWLLTPKGDEFLRVVEQEIAGLLAFAGAFDERKLAPSVARRRGVLDSYEFLAALDYLCERGDLQRLSSSHEEGRVYVHGPSVREKVRRTAPGGPT